MSTPPNPSMMRGARRKVVDASNVITTRHMPGLEGTMPLVLEPAVAGVDLSGWLTANLAEVEGHLDRYGALLFRGFELNTTERFEAVASAVAPDLFAEYGDLPTEETSQRVYQSTPYPADKMILFHNESSHLPSWPLRQFFACVVPSATGGTTPLLDCRKVCSVLDPELLEEFAAKGLLYVRNFAEGVDVPWQDFFKTHDKAEVERACAEAGMTAVWTDGDGLRVTNQAPAVLDHPRTGERLFFNQIQLHHPRCLDEATRAALEQLFSAEEMPRTVHFGDGTPIPDEVVDRIGEIYEDLCVEFPWDSGDLIVLDNMLTAHARRPFSGERRIIVAMARMTSA